MYVVTGNDIIGLQESGVSLKHIESRPAQSDPDAKYDYFLECGFPKLSPPTLEQAQQHQQKHDRLIAQLRELSSCVTITSSPNGGPENPEGGKEEPEIPWFPKCIAELDRCCTNLHKYGHELTPDHPVSCNLKLFRMTIGGARYTRINLM